MSAPDESRLSAASEKAEGSAKPPQMPPAARPWNAAYLWAGILVVVLVGGVVLGLSLSTLAESCTNNPTGLPLQGSALCSDNFVSGAVEAATAAAAFVVGVLLFVRARIALMRRIPLAAGILVAVVLVVAAVPAMVPPHVATFTARPELGFPMPAGTTFVATQGAFDAFAEPTIPPDRYVPWAIIELQGTWNATSVVCLAVVQAKGQTLGPGLGVVCGTAVSFVFVLDATTYVFAFYVPAGQAGATQAQVVITSDVGIVY